MASSSSSLNNSCFQCRKSSTRSLWNGWKLHNGEFSQLCHDCHYLYKVGRFCETFHLEEEGWRDCKSCRMLVHCGCIVTLSDYIHHDLGGIVCVDCWKSNFRMALDHSNAELYPIDLNKPANPSWIEPQDLEMQSIPPEIVAQFLFSKILSASDTVRKNGRILIPKEHAEAYFPDISVSLGVQLEILDTDGKAWELYFHCRRSGNSRVYMLRGLKGFMILNDFQAGDTVDFFRRESDRKIIMSLRKTSVVTQTHQALV